MIPRSEKGFADSPSSLKYWMCSFLVMVSISSTQASSWYLTPNSKVGFYIDSFGMTLVKGQFEQVQAELQFDKQQPEQARAQVVLDIHSISLNKPSWKEAVLGPDLFYVEKYKTATFQSTQFRNIGEHQYQIQGNLTLRGVTRPISFQAKMFPNPNNPNLIDIRAFTVIRRSDFGMKKAMAGIGEKVNIQVIGQWKNSD